MKRLRRWLLGHPMAQWNKALAGFAGVLGQLVPALALHGRPERVAEVVLALVTALATYAVPNAPPAGGTQ